MGSMPLIQTRYFTLTISTSLRNTPYIWNRLMQLYVHVREYMILKLSMYVRSTEDFLKTEVFHGRWPVPREPKLSVSKNNHSKPGLAINFEYSEIKASCCEQL